MDKKELVLTICKQFLAEIQKDAKRRKKELDSSFDMKIHEDSTKLSMKSDDSVFTVTATMTATITVTTPYTIGINTEILSQDT